MPDAPRSGVFLWVFNESRYLQNSAVRLRVAILASQITPRRASEQVKAEGSHTKREIAAEVSAIAV
jgi:hypothetical protein